MKKILLVGIMIIASFILPSCGPSEIVVTNRPSPPVYVRPIAPSPAYVWVEGDWVVRGNKYYWREGYWARARGSRAWVAGSWQSRNNGWYWRRGHWR